MRELNQELLNWTRKECGTIGAEYYESFLKMSNKEMKLLIAAIMGDSVDYINKQLFSGKWKDADIYDHFTYHLELMAQGILGIRESDGKLVISSPVEPRPDAEMGKRLDEKIKNAMPLIMDVFEEIRKRRIRMNVIKVFFARIAKKRSVIGKIIILLIAIFAFYRCVIKPPIYYMDSYKNKVYDKKEASYGQVSTVDISKLLSELLGLGILGGLVYFVLIKKND